MDEKKELRRKFSALRKELKTEVRDRIICARVLSNENVMNADVVLLYASFRSEVNTWELAEQLLMKKKTVAFPRCGENGDMTFHIVGGLSQLRDAVPGKYDICEPDSSLPQPEVTGKSVCIVPGLAFTENGGRLGYGGGYYDRFLEEFPGVKIALAYEGMIAEELPLMPHDMKSDIIVTEERTVLCNG